MNKQQGTNGMDLNNLRETVEIIKDSPTRAKCTFQVRSQWVEGGYSKTTIVDFHPAENGERAPVMEHVFLADEPSILGGSERGINPAQYLLIALGSCFTASLVYHASIQGVVIQALETQLEGDIDLHGFLELSGKTNRGYEFIRLKVNIRSDATQERIKELCQAAQQCSPIGDTLTRSIPIHVHVVKG